MVTTNEGYMTIGYRGSNPYDAGVFYCPYVPLQMVRAVGENKTQPKIGFKTRYGMISNPFVGSSPSDGLASRWFKLLLQKNRSRKYSIRFVVELFIKGTLRRPFFYAKKNPPLRKVMTLLFHSRWGD